MGEFLDFLKKKEVKEFIQDNIHASPQKLILNPPKGFKEHIKIIADQILSRQKAKGKLDDWAANFDLILPPPLSLEQASSRSTSEYKKTIVQGEQLVDLTGGMGIDCLSLGEYFKEVTYVEKQTHLCEVFQHNCEALERKIHISNDDAEQVLNHLENKSSKRVFYIDPARRDEAKNKVFKLEDCSPNLNEMMPLMRAKASQVLIKLSPFIDIKSVLKEFSHVREVHVVSVKNDCKELLILIDFLFVGEPSITAVNLETSQSSYSFDYSEEEKCDTGYGELKKYLFEPNASILKAGSFKKIGSDFDLQKLGQHTHLYTSNFDLERFPGKVYQVITKADKSTIKKYSANGTLNVITRNYPLKADALKKKWKLKDGGDYFLIGFKDLNEKAGLVIAKKLF